MLLSLILSSEAQAQSVRETREFKLTKQFSYDFQGMGVHLSVDRQSRRVLLTRGQTIVLDPSSGKLIAEYPNYTDSVNHWLTSAKTSADGKFLIQTGVRYYVPKSAVLILSARSVEGAKESLKQIYYQHWPDAFTAHAYFIEGTSKVLSMLKREDGVYDFHVVDLATLKSGPELKVHSPSFPVFSANAFVRFEGTRLVVERLRLGAGDTISLQKVYQEDLGGSPWNWRSWASPDGIVAIQTSFPDHVEVRYFDLNSLQWAPLVLKAPLHTLNLRAFNRTLALSSDNSHIYVHDMVTGKLIARSALLSPEDSRFWGLDTGWLDDETVVTFTENVWRDGRALDWLTLWQF